MDPQFLARLNALQNYQNQQANQANLEQLQANESELRKLRQLLSEEANKPQCPHCGGPTEKGFDRCKNCGQEVIWCGHFVGKPSDRDELEMAMEQYELGIKRKQEAQWQRIKEEAARKKKAQKKWEVAHPGHNWSNRKTLESKWKRQRDVRDDTVGALGCLAIILLVFFFLVPWLSSLIKRTQ